MDQDERERHLRRILILEMAAAYGVAALVGVIAGVATGNPGWGFAAVFLFSALILVVWLVAMVASPKRRRAVFGIYRHARQNMTHKRGKLN